jgi:radical SAM superfamily enzyme YgiQ (UPF0313 family)
MAKVLLVQPHIDIRKPQVLENAPLPINLVYVGTAIEDKHQVKIYDRNLIPGDNEFLDYVKNYSPDIIGLNSITSEMLFDLMHLGKMIKSNFPKIIILVGGVHATIEPDSILNEPYIDYILRGEGEAAFLEFCDTFDKNPKKLKKLKNVNKNPLRPFVNMDDLKLPNYDLVDIKKYGIFYVNMSRGCPGDCSFCYSPKMWGINDHPHIRAYSLEKTKLLFKELIEKYNVKVFSIVDDNFVPFKSRAIEICRFLEGYKLHFFCFGRADYVNDEILRALKKAGCHTIQIGIESGNQRVLDFLNKKVSVQQNIEAIKCCKRNGITLDASCMAGITSETIEELKDTVNMIKTYKPDIVNMKVFNPMPGTKLFDYCIQKGLFQKPKTLEEWALWTGGMTSVYHNTSEIPDDTLTKTVEEMWMTGFYKNKIKRFIYWMRIGEYGYVLKSMKRIFEVRGGIFRIPGLGFITNLFNKK